MERHLLAASHILLGAVNLLVLTLPDGWRLATGCGQPEVDRTVEAGGCRWMKQGRAWYYLWPAAERMRLELVLYTDERGARIPEEILEEGVFSASGHDGNWVLGYRRGLFRTPVPLLWAALDCPRTGRRLEFELTGPPGPAALAPLASFAGTLAEIGCH